MALNGRRPVEARATRVPVDGRPPSATALRALRRARISCSIDCRCSRIPALRISGAGESARIQADPEEFDRAEWLPPAAFRAVWSRFAEDQLAEAVSGGVRQYVVPGAGPDTFAYRNPSSSFGSRGGLAQ
jgi:hypothetical protein